MPKYYDDRGELKDTEKDDGTLEWFLDNGKLWQKVLVIIGIIVLIGIAWVWLIYLPGNLGVSGGNCGPGFGGC